MTTVPVWLAPGECVINASELKRRMLDAIKADDLEDDDDD